MAGWDDLQIKGVGDNALMDAYTTYHVRMGKGFIDALENGIQLKEPIENNSRLEDGVRMLISTKKAKRNVTLTFNIFGSTKAEYMTNKKSFEEMLYKGMADFKVNDDAHQNIYHLVYTGKSVSYSHSYNGKFGVFVAQFTEPNPANRTADANAYVRVIDSAPEPEPEEPTDDSGTL